MKRCKHCEKFFARYRCSQGMECDCPKCQGYCTCKKVDDDKLDAKTLVVLAAVAGGTNLGMPLPEKQTVDRLLACDNLDMDHAVVSLWRDYMENDEHYTMFLEECTWWLRGRKNFNGGKSKSARRNYVCRVWPDIAAVMGFAT